MDLVIYNKLDNKNILTTYLEQNGLTLSIDEPIGNGNKKPRDPGGVAISVNDQEK